MYLEYQEPYLKPSDPDPDPQHRETAVIESVLHAVGWPSGTGPGPTQRHVPGVPVGPGDDAAVLADGTVVTVDALIEGVHWDDRLSPADVGYKAVAASVSDLAAMGARPAWMVLVLALRDTGDLAWTEAFARGLAEAGTRWSVLLVGGDTVRTPGPRMVSITMGGHAVGVPVTRAGATAGDDIWVTGQLGLAGAGYRFDAPPAEALASLRRPEPPLEFALDLASAGAATAMMDLSDGLASDLPRLCQASAVGAVVDPAALPAAECLRARADLLSLQVSSGDDYELLFTAAPHRAALVESAAKHHGVRATRIGTITAERTVTLRGAAWPPAAFVHFTGTDA